MEQKKYRFYNRNKYIEEYVTNPDGTETSTKSWRILEKQLIHTKPYNFRLCICTDTKSHDKYWFKVTYFDPYRCEITVCDDETIQEYEQIYGRRFDNNIGKYC